MAALSDTNLTLLDRLKRQEPDGSITKIVELLTQTNDMLRDMPWKEGTDEDGTQFTLRADLPVPSWVGYNEYTTPTKSRTAQAKETCGMMKMYSQVDKALADRGGQAGMLRATEDVAFMEGMNQELISTVLYGDNTVNFKEFYGLAPRYASQSAVNGRNIITSAATPDNTDNSSIWLIYWGDETVFGLYPRATKGGLVHTDLGVQLLQDSSGGFNRFYVSEWSWHCGIAVKDWRAVVRINFDAEDLVYNNATGPNLRDLMVQAIHKVPSHIKRMGRPAFYMNSDTFEYLDRQSMNNSLLAFQTIKTAQGEEVDSFRRIPVRITDAITNTESGI